MDHQCMGCRYEYEECTTCRSTGKYGYRTNYKRIDLNGQDVVCITRKYGNFTYGKRYVTMVHGICKHYPENNSFRIEDDDGDYFSIDVKEPRFWKMFKIVPKEE